MSRLWCGLTAVMVLVGLVAFAPASRTLAAGVVGNGTPGSCDETALETALNGGGLVTFNCGAAPHTIPLTSEKVVSTNTDVDGGGLITIDGQNQTRIFSVNSGVTLDLRNITLTRGNGTGATESGEGGAIYNYGVVTMLDSTLTNNSAGRGGAIYSNGASAEVVVTDSIVSGNSAVGPFAEGGAIVNDLGTFTISGSTISGNSITGSSGSGGAIFSSDGPFTITHSTLSGNSIAGSNGLGGAIYSEFTALIISHSTLSDNSSEGDSDGDGDGGAIYTDVGTLLVSNSTLSGNAATKGGAILNWRGTTTLANSTLSDNTAALGGAIYVNSDTAMFQNSIIANSGAPSGPGDNCSNSSGTLTSLGGNLSDDDTCNLTDLSDLPNTEDNLGPLADNGGPTQTHLPQTGSPAIDNAVSDGCPAVDQRGIDRPQGDGCDIGSVEVGRTATYPLCVAYATGRVTSPLFGQGCAGGTVEITPFDKSFCIDTRTGQLLYLFRGSCNPPRFEHTLPDDGDLLTCVSYATGTNRWVFDHSQCGRYELLNTIPATP